MKRQDNFLPSEAVKFLSLDEVNEIHTVLIERFGGPAGVSDLGLCESVLYRPQTGYQKSLSEMAAAMFESLIKNYPFVDRNKHVSFLRRIFSCV